MIEKAGYFLLAIETKNKKTCSKGKTKSQKNHLKSNYYKNKKHQGSIDHFKQKVLANTYPEYKYPLKNNGIWLYPRIIRYTTVVF